MILFFTSRHGQLDDDHYDLGTGDNSIFIRKLDLYGLTLPQLHLSYV